MDKTYVVTVVEDARSGTVVRWYEAQQTRDPVLTASRTALWLGGADLRSRDDLEELTALLNDGFAAFTRLQAGEDVRDLATHRMDPGAGLIPVQ